jgi:NitT/TauT family transport system substrate-binding protein
VFIDGAEMAAKLGGYLAELYAQDPAAVGGALPDDAFYYAAE